MMKIPRNHLELSGAMERKPRLAFRSILGPLPKNHAAALGQVVVSWNTVEGYCAYIIARLLNLDGEVKHAATAELSFLQRVAVVSSLLNAARNPDFARHWKEIVALLDPLRIERNDIVHAEWSPVAEDGHMIRIQARGKVVVRNEVITVDQMLSLESRIVEMVDQLAWFAEALSRAGKHALLEGASSRAPLDTIQSPQSLAQDQARARKRDHKDRSRAHPLNLKKRKGAP